MIKKEAFQNLKGRRIYQFYLDEDTGEITDITSRNDYVQVIRCKDCKYAEKSGKNVDCRKLHLLMYNDEYCSMGKRKEE